MSVQKILLKIKFVKQKRYTAFNFWLIENLEQHEINVIVSVFVSMQV